MPVLLDSFADRIVDSARARVATTAPLSIQVLQSLVELDQFAEQWGDLVGQAESSPYQSFAWNRAWFARFAEDYDEMAVFVFLRGATPIVILPLYRKGSAYRLAGDSICEHQDAIAATVETVGFALESIMEWMRQRHCHLEFRRLLAGSWIESALERDDACWQDNLHFHSSEPLAYYRMPESPEDLYGPLPLEERETLRRAFRRLARDFDQARFACERPEAGSPDLVREILDLCDREGSTGFGSRKDKRKRAFLLDLAKSEDSGLRLATLRDDHGKLLAAEIGVSGTEHFQSLLNVAREGLEKYRLRDWVLLKLVDWLDRKDDIRTLGFPSGEDRAFLWHAEHQEMQVESCYLFPMGPINLARWAGIHAGHSTLRVSRQLLQRAGLYKPMM